MKKTVFTLMLLAVASIVSAQSLQFEHDGHVYENNEIVVCTAPLNIIGEMIQEMHLRNSSNETVSVMLRKEPLQEVEGTQNSFCWGLCVSPDVYVSPFPVDLDGNTVSDDGALSFHYQVNPNYTDDPATCIPGTTIVRYYAYPEREPENAVCIEIWFVYDAESVTENIPGIGSAYPNPARSQVHFDLQANGNENINVTVYNLLGQEVKSQLVNGSQSRISIAVDDLQPGIYFCSFQVNNEAVRTEKFIVKR